MSLRQLSKYGIAAGIALGTVASLRNNQWDVERYGIIRFGRTVFTVGCIAVDYKLTLYNLSPDSEVYRQQKSKAHERAAANLLKLCCANGGVFIKVGQHLGALDLLLPSEYVSTLRILHSKAPKSPLEDVLHVIKEDLKDDPNELFSSFDPEPIGAASLAQVHKAITKDGTTVAVKVQHRFVKARSFVDLKTMEVLVHLIARIFPDFQLMWLAEETKKNLPLELDFVHEGKNAERVRRMFAHFSWFKVPCIYWEYTSPRVLTMEFCEGGQVNDKSYMKMHSIPAREVTRNLGNLYSEMIFSQGYVHCDPHPGNILVNNAKGKLEIVLLDHGLYQTLTNSFRLSYANMWLSLIKADTIAMEQNAASLGVPERLFRLFASMLTARAWRHVQAGIDKHPVSDTEGKAIKEYVSSNLHLIAEVLNIIPREMLLIFKTNDLLRSIEHSLGSPANASSFITMSRCCVRAITRERLSQCRSMWCQFSLNLVKFWTLLKISLYELCLHFTSAVL